VAEVVSVGQGEISDEAHLRSGGMMNESELAAGMPIFASDVVNMLKQSAPRIDLKKTIGLFHHPYRRSTCSIVANALRIEFE
jgi:hypothetical protein